MDLGLFVGINHHMILSRKPLSPENICSRARAAVLDLLSRRDKGVEVSSEKKKRGIF
jgi:hypothetical protein